LTTYTKSFICATPKHNEEFAKAIRGQLQVIVNDNSQRMVFKREEPLLPERVDVFSKMYNYYHEKLNKII